MGKFMPPPPRERMTIEEVRNKYNTQSGIYFAWKDSKCVYVGKTINFNQRLNTRRKEICDCLLSVLEMKPKDIHHAELYYIWKLKPERNNETRLQKKDAKRFIPIMDDCDIAEFINLDDTKDKSESHYIDKSSDFFMRMCVKYCGGIPKSVEQLYSKQTHITMLAMPHISALIKKYRKEQYPKWREEYKKLTGV